MTVVELVLFRTLNSIDDAQLLAASERVSPILRSMPGFISRELAVAKDGRWADIVHWANLEMATNAAKNVMQNETCLAYFAMIDQSSLDFTHFEVQSLESMTG